MLKDENFEIRFDYKASVGSADRVFLIMAEYVSAFEELIHVVGQSIDPDIDFNYQLSSVRQGSIKGVLSCVSPRKAFNKVLSRVPLYIASSMVEIDEIDCEEDIEKLEKHLKKKVKNTMEMEFPNELNINKLGLAEGYKRLVRASDRLIDGETIDLKSNDNNVIYLNTKVKFDKDPSSFFVEMFREVKKIETLLIKKIVFIGDSMWDFQSIERRKSFSAPILHEEWLSKFQNRCFAHIDPGDAIIALVSYDANKEKGSKNFRFSNHKVLHVERLIKSNELQTVLDLENDE